MKKPKRINPRKHHFKDFSYLLKGNKKSKHQSKGGHPLKTHTVRDSNGKSIIRNMNEVFKPLIFSDFNYMLSGTHSLTDIDGQLEINGNIFIIESKSRYSSINGGQLVSLFHNAYNTWRSGKIGQLTYRVSTGKSDSKGNELFDFIIFGTKQFEEYDSGVRVTPTYELDKTNKWLAERLYAFQDACFKTHDKDTQIKNCNLFGSIDIIKRHLQTRGKFIPF